MKAYSTDLREKVISKHEKGWSFSRLIKTFEISDSSIRRWIRNKKKTGSLDPKKNNHQRRPKLISDLAAFQKHVEEHPELTAKERAVVFNVSASTILRSLRKISFTKKKDFRLLRKK